MRHQENIILNQRQFKQSPKTMTGKQIFGTQKKGDGTTPKPKPKPQPIDPGRWCEALDLKQTVNIATGYGK